MVQVKIYSNKISSFFILALLLLIGGKVQAQCEFGLSSVKVPSTCAANGKITISLTGGNVGSLSNILYSLQSLTNSYSIAPGASPVFENLPPDTYRATVTAVCNSAAVEATLDVTVTGTYVAFSGGVGLQRIALKDCNTGQAIVTLNNGKAPYHISISNAPGDYTGRTSFTTSAPSLIIDSLVNGNYTFTMTDSCSADASVVTTSITELPAMSSNMFILSNYADTAKNCKLFIVASPRIYNESVLNAYINFYRPITFSVSYNGGAKLPYKSIYNQIDSIELPSNQTFKDAWGKKLTYYIKSPCGDEVSFDVTLSFPTLNLLPKINCAVDFDANFEVVGGSLVCHPTTMVIRNNSTMQTWSDTRDSLGAPGKRSIRNLPFGNYRVTMTSGDGAIIYQQDSFKVAPNITNPYSITLFHSNGYFGNDGRAFFVINRSVGSFVEGTKIDLISSPPGFFYTRTIQPNFNSSSIPLPASTQSPYPIFTVGSYIFLVTDSCGVYELPITIQEKDVYRYNWSYTTEQTCNGLKITPTGTAIYNNTPQPTYFKIHTGPQGTTGFDPAIVPSGGSLILPLVGSYRIGVSTTPVAIYDYPSTAKVVDYVYQPLAIDVNRSLGWVCPARPDTSGAITAYAVGGSKAATGVYTYKLFAEGTVASGNYLAMNTTGKFSTATSGGAYTLVANQNYDVQVIDECNAKVEQTFKIVDFATAQVAFADRPEYCIGDKIRFSVINLPSSAIFYEWSGPNGFFNTLKNPVINNIQPRHAGNYYVKISSDICQDPIRDTLTIALAPYVEICYSAVTDTSVNPYAYGLLGNWRPARSYAYYGERKESDPSQATNIRHDGTYKDFAAFWEIQNNKWKAKQDTTKWVWNAESTLFNKKGFELENRDPLGRYNTAVYGYENAFPVAVVQNSRYREAAFEGFEDYGFDSKSCEAACATDRRFDFSSHLGKIDTTQHHSGRSSLKVLSTDAVGIVSIVSDTAADAGVPTFNTGTSSCSPLPVLKSVKVNSSALLPAFSPLAGKKVIVSAWVKEAQDCKCTTYESNQINIVVNGSSDSVVIIAKPSGAIIDGWQRYEQVVDLPVGTRKFALVLKATGSAAVYFDDIRVHPYHGNMKSFVYDPTTLRLMAELDENNYATFFEYDDDGSLTRVKKETERGVKTIKETRSALIKE